MEESKELQGAYKIFRAVIYISILDGIFRVCRFTGDAGPLERHTLRCAWPHQDVAYLPRRKSCLQQDSDLCAYLHHVRGYKDTRNIWNLMPDGRYFIRWLAV